MFEIVVLFILIAPIIVKLINLHYNKNENKEEDDFLVIVYEAFRELINGKK